MSALLVGSALVLAGAARADEPPKPWYSLVQIDGFASASYTYNLNDPKSKLNGLRAFDYDHNSFRIDAAELVLQKPVADRGDFGFRLDLAFGPVARVGAARGLFRDPATGTAGDIDLQQAFVSYVIPLGKGLRVDIGKFITVVGTEYIDGYDGYNDNFSRSLLFLYAIPFTHTGVKLTYVFNDKLTAIAFVANGWDNVLDNNAAKSFGLQLDITPHPSLNIYLSYLGGPEQDGNDTDFRHLADVGVAWKPHWRFAATLNFDYGMDTNGVTLASSVPTTGAVDPASAKRADAQWTGIALYLRAQATHRLGFIVRGELFWDLDGVRTGTAQRVGELTLTPELRIKDNLLLRGEVRFDQSDAFVFEKSDGTKRKYQTTLALNALFAF